MNNVVFPNTPQALALNKALGFEPRPTKRGELKVTFIEFQDAVAFTKTLKEEGIRGRLYQNDHDGEVSC